MDPKLYYSNPAFCQQSEFYPNGSMRQSPLGAQTIHHPPEEKSVDVEEQEFYEEVLVDDHGFIKGKKIVVVAQDNEGKKYIQDQTKTRSPSSSVSKSRYEYIPMKEQQIASKPPLAEQPTRVHRYAIIEPEEETELTTADGRYALVPVNQLVHHHHHHQPNRYEYIQERQQNRYEYLDVSPVKPRYKYQRQSTPEKVQRNQRPPVTNLAATRKLHEILSTPKKVRSPTRIASPSPISPINNDPFQSPKVMMTTLPRRAQQKLNYTIGANNNNQSITMPKRHTAIVPPMCSSPIPASVYGDTTTISQKSESWMNLSTKQVAAAGRALAAAAFVLILCGIATTGLCFYMLSFMGRPYYLDFGTVAGFTCTVMGLLGCRSRNVYWLPNRNYLSGYMVLSIFSILTCGGLVVLMVYEPRPGTALADMTSAAVCGFSVLTLLLALTGVVSSYCCKYPPPDNRVQHCSPGLTV